MRICVCLRGIHYLNIDNYKTDFRLSVENYKENIIQPLINKGHTIDIICLTYESDIMSDVYKLYNPVKTLILPATERSNGSNWARQCIFHIKSIQVIEEYESTQDFRYDIIINTRFDMIFNNKITECDIDMNKMNITFKHDSGNCDDNIFIFPRKYIDSFVNSFNILLSSSRITHEFNREFSEENIHYMLDVKDYKKHFYLNRYMS